MRLTSSILTDFAAAIITPPDSNGVQTTRGTVVSVDEEDEKKVTLRLDGSNEDCEATTMVECEEGDRVMVMIKNHKATVIGNISNPVLKKVTANKVEAGAIHTDALESHAVTADKITTENISGINGWINFSSGTFNYGNGKLTWDGSVLTVDGTLTAGAGSKIGPWNIEDDCIWKVNKNWGNKTANAAYFGNEGISITNKFKVSKTGNLTVASDADITGKITATSGKIGSFDIDSSGLKYKVGVAESHIYPASIYLKTGTSASTTTAQLSSDELNFVPWGSAGGGVTTIGVFGLSTQGYVSASGDVSGNKGTFSGTVSGSYGSFTGNVIVTAGAAAVGAKDTHTTVQVSVHSANSGNHGVYTTGYYNGSNFVSDARWIIYRGTNGKIQVPNFLLNAGYVPISSSVNGQIISGLRTYNASTFQVRAQWGSTGTADSNFEWKTITSSASDPKLKYNIADSKVKALDILRQIKLHSFNWKVDNTHWDIGFIAPELYEIDKNLAIKPLDENTSWGVNDFYLLGIVVKAIQELERRLDEQRN